MDLIRNGLIKLWRLQGDGICPFEEAFAHSREVSCLYGAQELGKLRRPGGIVGCREAPPIDFPWQMMSAICMTISTKALEPWPRDQNTPQCHTLPSVATT